MSDRSSTSSIGFIQEQSYRIAKAHGFWDGPEQDNIPTKIALVHEEVSEALGEFREGHEPTEVYWHYESGPATELVDFKHELDGTDYIKPATSSSQWHPVEPGKMHEVMISLGYRAKPEGFGIELADALIRIADLAERHGIDLEAMIALKSAYNETRPYMHGRKI